MILWLYTCTQKNSYHHLIIYHLSIHSAKHTPHHFTKKIQYHFKSSLRASWYIFFWCIKISSSILTHKNLPPTVPPSHHLFLDPPTLVRALQSWVRFPIHDRSETTSGRPTWRFFWEQKGKVEIPRASNKQLQNFWAAQNKWSKINWVKHWVYLLFGDWAFGKMCGNISVSWKIVTQLDLFLASSFSRVN